MARYPHHHIHKLPKTKLKIRVRNAFYHPPCPCPSNCSSSSSPLHVTFCTHFKQRFLKPRCVSLSSSDSSAVIGKREGVVDEKTICQDGRLFFEVQEEANSRVAVETVLGSLGVKKSEYGRIFEDVMAFGRDNLGNEKKGLEGLVVILTSVQTCFGERASVHEAMKKSFRECKAQDREKEDMLLIGS